MGDHELIKGSYLNPLTAAVPIESTPLHKIITLPVHVAA